MRNFKQFPAAAELQTYFGIVPIRSGVLDNENRNFVNRNLGFFSAALHHKAAILIFWLKSFFLHMRTIVRGSTIPGRIVYLEDHSWMFLLHHAFQQLLEIILQE